MAGPTTIRIDVRTILPIAALGVVVLVIIFVELCGREQVQPLAEQTPLALSSPAATFTPGPSPTAPPADATATQQAQAGGSERDQKRLQDVGALRDALAQYQVKHNAFPNTNGAVQTLCVFGQFDQGCKLKEVLNPLPEDPLGDPTTNGYWYASDGISYVLYAQRESSMFPECPDHPPFLEDLRSLLCLSWPS